MPKPKKIKILFDYSPACREDKTGIPLFVEHLYSELQSIETVEVHNTLCISKYVSRKHWKTFRFFEKILYHNIYLPFKLTFGNYDVYIENQYMFNPLFKPKNTLIVTFIYDIALALFDDLQTEKHTLNWRRKLPMSIKNSDLLMTISKSSKEDIEKYLNDTQQPMKPVEYVYADTDTLKSTHINAQSILESLQINEDFFLFLGTLEPRKNPLKIIEAFHLFKMQTKSKMKLVFAGKKGWLYDDVIAYITTHHLEDEVIFTGYISNEEKVTLLTQTKAFLFISLYEGFGMPALEALKIGTPTLLSDIPVFHELFEKNALYTNYNDPRDIAEKMKNILNNPPQIDTDLFHKFSWKESASNLVLILSKHMQDIKN